MHPPASGDTWIELTEAPLSLGVVADWVVRPDCGAVAAFSGTVRDHAEGRDGVTSLAYEAYVEQAEPKMAEVVDAVRARWPDVRRVAVLHRVGELALTESSVVIAVSSPHRAEAFEAARFAIDELKATVPIWKRETWGEGADWALGAHELPGPEVTA